MSNIDKEINEIAEKMAKSTASGTEILKSTIMEMGPEGLKKAISATNEDGTPVLSEENVQVLKSFIEEISKAKAVAMDDEYTPKKTETKAEDMKTESLSGSDDEDEDLVKKKAKEQKHQGDNSPEGFEGQVIKAEGPSMAGGAGSLLKADKEDKKEDKAKKKLAEAVDEVAESEVKEHEKEMHKSEDLEKSGVPTGAGSRGGEVIGYTKTKRPVYASTKKDQHKEWLRADHKDAAQLHREFANKYKQQAGDNKKVDTYDKYTKLAEQHSSNADYHDSRTKDIKKGEEQNMTHEELIKSMDEGSMYSMMTKMCDKGMEKSKILDIVMGKGADEVMAKACYEKLVKEYKVEKSDETSDDLEKGKMKEKMLSEEDQVKAKMVDKEKKEKISEEDADLKEKVQETADEALAQVPKMKKSVEWAPKNLLAANTLGRNSHYSVEDEIVKSEESFKDKLEKGAMYLNEEGETLEKSDKEGEEKKDDLNDLIEKSMDTTWGEIEINKRKAEAEAAKNGTLQKSFQDEDLYASLGMSEEEAKKVLGE